jgi:hypothetical protein
MKFFKKLLGSRKDEAEVQKLVETFSKPKQNTGIEISSESMSSTAPVPLRSHPTHHLSQFEVQKMVQTKDFVDSGRNKEGKGIQHQYELIKLHENKIVIDHTTGLVWQQSGSDVLLNYELAEAYITNLNQENFGGHSNWRLPTVEEAISLVEPANKQGGLSIDQIFDDKQRWIWTADTGESDLQAWAISFTQGGGSHVVALRNDLSVRAVCLG